MNPGFTACANTTPAENVELPQPVDGRSSGKNKNLVDLAGGGGGGGWGVLSQEVSAFCASDAFFLALTTASTLKVGGVCVCVYFIWLRSGMCFTCSWICGNPCLAEFLLFCFFGFPSLLSP